MKNKFSWYGVTRQQLPGLLVGIDRPKGDAFEAPELARAREVDAIVGYEPMSLAETGLQAPVVVLIDDSRIQELLAWLHTYSAESFPLSHYCRIQSFSDWLLVTGPSEVERDFIVRPLLSSLIVGEMLAQAESDLNLTGVPLSWAAGCFSLAMNQALKARGSSRHHLTRLAADRLRSCEQDSRFAGRTLCVDMLAPMWAMVAEVPMTRQSVTEICFNVVSALSSKSGQFLESNEALHSSSAEQRVDGFDATVEVVIGLVKSGSQFRSEAGCLLAAAALLVGKGTSHLELLRPLQAELPESLGWFGLMAGFAGPEAWDSAWLRLAKGVERQLRTLTVNSVTSGEADLSWMEYEWLNSHTSLHENSFVGFPKRNLRSLTIEILPGSPCQFRLLSAHRALAINESRLEKEDLIVVQGAQGGNRWDTVKKAATELALLIESAMTIANKEDSQQPLFELATKIGRKSSNNKMKTSRTSSKK